MCYIDNNKRETVSGYPDNNIAIILQTAVTIAVVAAIYVSP